MIIVNASKETDIMKEELKALSKIRSSLISNSIAKEICKENGFDKDILNGIPIDFDKDLDVSARTKDARVLLNSTLMDKDFEIMMRYVIHELTHVFHHLNDESDREKKKDYLDRNTEMEAFQNQIKYDSKARSKEDAIEYVEELIEFHDIPKKEKKKKKEELLEKT